MHTVVPLDFEFKNLKIEMFNENNFFPIHAIETKIL